MDYEIAISITELSQVNIVTFFEMETLELRNNMCKQYRQVRFIFFLGGGQFPIFTHLSPLCYRLFRILPRCFRLAILFTNIKQFPGRDSSVGTATRCGLDGPGIECR